ncbi:MAG: hypothetical protein HQM09_18155, partial [Candidatus Riflebacteria bacterium]|nr:hypothetical protein [Candidatus Riflebacteria bacterium]
MNEMNEWNVPRYSRLCFRCLLLLPLWGIFGLRIMTGIATAGEPETGAAKATDAEVATDAGFSIPLTRTVQRGRMVELSVHQGELKAC